MKREKWDKLPIGTIVLWETELEDNLAWVMVKTGDMEALIINDFYYDFEESCATDSVGEYFSNLELFLELGEIKAAPKSISEKFKIKGW